MTVLLGPRLQAVADYVPQGAKLGDIGTDHAYLPISLYEKGIITQAVGVDIHQGPYMSALNAVKERKLENSIAIRLGNGLLPLCPGEVDVLTIAGMGGRTMLEIIQSKTEVVEQTKMLALQPQGAEGSVRLRLLQQGWFLWDERLVEEDDRIYIIMAFSREKGWNLNDLKREESLYYDKVKEHLSQEWKDKDELIYPLFEKIYWQAGPLIISKREKLLDEQLEEGIRQLNKQIKEMSKTDRPEVRAKIGSIEMEIEIIQKVRDISREDDEIIYNHAKEE